MCHVALVHECAGLRLYKRLQLYKSGRVFEQKGAKMLEKNREILETITLHVDNIVIQLQSSDIF